MSYADSLLTDGEYVVYRTRQHPLARVLGAKWGILLLGIGVALAVLFVFFDWKSTQLSLFLAWAIPICLILGVILVGWTYLGWSYEDYLITNRRVIKSTGILSKKAADSSLEKINDAILEQSIWGRMMDWGSLQILTASDMMDVDYRMLHHAPEFKKVMLMTKNDLETGTDRRSDIRRAPVAPPIAEPLASAPVGPEPVTAAASVPTPAAAPPAPPTAEEKLRSLAKLRDDGIISAEDYEAKKAELLNQL